MSLDFREVEGVTQADFSASTWFLDAWWRIIPSDGECCGCESPLFAALSCRARQSASRQHMVPAVHGADGEDTRKRTRRVEGC